MGVKRRAVASVSYFEVWGVGRRRGGVGRDGRKRSDTGREGEDGGSGGVAHVHDVLAEGVLYTHNPFSLSNMINHRRVR